MSETPVDGAHAKLLRATGGHPSTGGDGHVSTCSSCGAAGSPLASEKSDSRSIEGKLARNEWQPIPASRLGDGDQIDWVWVGWAARGFTTLLIGLWKAGKTTLLAWLLRACRDGGDIAGQIQACKVLVVTEEGQALWARRRDQIGIGDNVHFLVRPFRGKPLQREWSSFVERLAALVRAEKYDLVVVDTWQSINPCFDENDAAMTMAALTPLHGITEAGAAVLLVHHPRKGDANEGQASRGSGALPGFVDVIAELRRYDPARPRDTRRVLRSYSRFDESPPEVVVNLDEDGYRTVGTVAESNQATRFRVVDEVLANAQGPLTADEVWSQWPEGGIPKPGKRTVATDLQAGHSASRWRRSGTGKKGDAYKYEKNSIRANSHP